MKTFTEHVATVEITYAVRSDRKAPTAKEINDRVEIELNRFFEGWILVGRLTTQTQEKTA